MPETRYETRNGINYAIGEDYAYCDRCGRRPIVNDKCLNCDGTEPSPSDLKLAKLIEQVCYERGHGRIVGFQDARSPHFDANTAAKIIATYFDPRHPNETKR